MSEWYLSLDAFQRVLLFIASPATVIFTVRTFLFISGGTRAPIDRPLLSASGFFAAAAVVGWSGIIYSELDMGSVPSAALAAGTGIFILFAAEPLVRLFAADKRGGPGKDIIGRTGRVYMPIPAKMRGKGQIYIMIKNINTKVAAVTAENSSITAGEYVKVVSADKASGVLVVERARGGEYTAERKLSGSLRQ